MPKVITIPDLGTSVASFDDYFLSFSVSNQTDGNGGRPYMATLSANIVDTDGNVVEQASVTWELGAASKSSLRDYIMAQGLPRLKASTGL